MSLQKCFHDSRIAPKVYLALNSRHLLRFSFFLSRCHHFVVSIFSYPSGSPFPYSQTPSPVCLDETSMVSERNIAIVDAFLALQLSGAGLFSLIVLSAWLTKGTKRHPIFYSFCLSWIVFGVSYALLLFSGQQFKHPGRVVCTIQASLIYASPFLEIGTSLGLTIHLFFNVMGALSSTPKKNSHRTFLNVLVTLPWLVWTGIFIGVLMVREICIPIIYYSTRSLPQFTIMHESQVVMSPNFTYCVIEGSAIPKVTAVATTIGGTAIIVIEFMIGSVLYRNRAIANVFSQSLGMAIRILIFTVLGIGALSVGIVFTVTRTRGVQFDLIIAILPPAAALTFGTQKVHSFCSKLSHTDSHQSIFRTCYWDGYAGNHLNPWLMRPLSHLLPLTPCPK
ncbi:hypothetical protein BDN70DRAFT_661831 [Pholiota conissans]|uniref:Uncharacterized protein n=1 Tax=Pholiota conissans TaxID=109636 RepID=A0A9P6D1P0_9AGAR|nr:hypothetical protein BDN70DRAFT_661831 [Pholiota conissans]